MSSLTSVVEDNVLLSCFYELFARYPKSYLFYHCNFVLKQLSYICGAL
jgi:hypothetical protein